MCGFIFLGNLFDILDLKQKSQRQQKCTMNWIVIEQLEFAADLRDECGKSSVGSPLIGVVHARVTLRGCNIVYRQSASLHFVKSDFGWNDFDTFSLNLTAKKVVNIS